MISDGSFDESTSGVFRARSVVQRLIRTGSIDYFWHKRIGTFLNDGQIVIREYAPNANYISLIGDFNAWDRGQNPLVKVSDNEWEIRLDYDRVIAGSRYKLHIAGFNGARDRIPSTCQYAKQSPDGDFAAIFDFEPLSPVTHIGTNQPLRIYELHIGLAADGPRIGTYREVADNVIQLVKQKGYTAVQLMAVHEHPYYGSFGYHVSNPYGICSRFGSRHDFKYLVDKCHESGLIVIIDLVHAHAVKNLAEGLGEFDGQQGYFFLKGENAIHPAWDSLVYDYQNPSTLSYLLSNAKYWIEEYGIDGFRVDGVTSILYHDHGIGHQYFTDHDYQGNNLNFNGLVYLTALCDLVHQCKSDAILIAEDVSGLPGLATPSELGGVGFDYRLHMGLPDYFEAMSKVVMADGMIPSEMWSALVTRRFDEKHVGYVESHDQAIVGGQSLIFRLLGAKMYTSMHVDLADHDVRVAVSVVNISKAVVALLGGEAWMSFIGNEFGHPDWVEFPTPENRDSFEYAYRKWFLATDDTLLYAKLAAFDKALMNQTLISDAWSNSYITAPLLDNERRLSVFHRNGVVLITNTNTVNSFEDVWVPVPANGHYKVLMSTEQEEFGGYGRVDMLMRYPSVTADGCTYIRLYVPSMSAILMSL